jgi:hypothetical protein
MRVNKEKLKAAMEAADRAEASGAAPDGTQDSVWDKQDELLRDAATILDDIKKFDHNFNIATSVATTIGTIVNSNELSGLLDSAVLRAEIQEAAKTLFPIMDEPEDPEKAAAEQAEACDQVYRAIMPAVASSLEPAFKEYTKSVRSRIMDHANTAIAGAAANVSAEHRLRMDEIETAMQAVLVELSSTHQ